MKLKKMLVPLLFCAILIVVACNINHITSSLAKILEKDPEIVILPSNKYTKNYDFAFVKRSSNYRPYSKGDLLDIIFTVLNNGWDTFTFYCPEEYTKCTSDIEEISNDQELLTHVNNYVHPYNSYISVKVSYSYIGEVTLKINKLYTKEEIKAVDAKVDELIIKLIKDGMEDEEKIKAIHDYIIDHAEYDINWDPKKEEKHENTYRSNTAYGALLQEHAICNGYTDAMAIFLSKLNIPNYKIATKKDNDQESKGHVWNAVKVNDTWLHLDLTWDDPVSKDGKDYLRHKYFLINNEELTAADKSETVQIDDHKFKPIYYLEFK